MHYRLENGKEEIKTCAQCGTDIDVKRSGYLMVGDNYLQVNYFDEQDGSDNVFCSESCLCEALSVMTKYE
jgi:hypothetical protein